MKAACYDCPNRKVGCHSTCEAYKKFAEARTQHNEDLLRARMAFNETIKKGAKK